MADTTLRAPGSDIFTLENLTGKIVTATCNGVVMWEIVNCLHSEVKHIFLPELKGLILHRKRPSLVSLLLFNSRVLAMADICGKYVCFALPNFTGRLEAIGVDILHYLLSFLVINGMAVFAIRTLAIRGSKKPMTIFVWFLHAIASAAALWFPIGGRMGWFAFLACSIGFDTFVIIASLLPQIEGWKWKPTYSRVSKRFYQDAILYFSISLVVLTLELGWSFTFFTPKCDVLSVHFWLSAAIPARIIRNLRLGSAKSEAKFKANSTPRTLSIDESPLDAQLRQLKIVHFSKSSYSVRSNATGDASPQATYVAIATTHM